MDQTINPLTQHTVSTVTIRNCSPYAIQIYWLFSWFFEKGLKQHFGKLNSYLSHPKYFTYHDALESSQLMISATCSPLTHTHTCTYMHTHTHTWLEFVEADFTKIIKFLMHGYCSQGLWSMGTNTFTFSYLRLSTVQGNSSSNKLYMYSHEYITNFYFAMTSKIYPNQNSLGEWRTNPVSFLIFSNSA